MSAPRILIACIGNIFLGDDAFGVEVARLLAQVPWPDSIHVEDFGIRGVDLAYALLNNYDVAIFVDASQQGHAPGTLFVLEPDLAPVLADAAAMETSIDAHSMDPAKVLRTAASMGGKIPRVFVVGCEPSPLPGDDEVALELSPPVRAAVPLAVPMIRDLVHRILSKSLLSNEAQQEISSCSPI